MAKAAKKKSAVAMIVFSRSRDIPFDRIFLSDSNVREINVEEGLEELTHDIDRREDIVQGLNVRAILDADGNETGDFETPAGGRRYKAIARLVEAGRFPADGPVPCLVKKANAKTSAVDDSLAENMVRLALHPLDQFKAFKRMLDGGMSKEEIADAYRTTPRFITQRLRLATAAPALLDAYSRHEMTLAMLEAFTVNPDHVRQEQVWERISGSWQKEPWQIRRMLTETTVPMADKRARFIGIDAYEAASGTVLRDLFSDDSGGWLEDVPLLDRLVDEMLQGTADELANQGWKWISASVELPYGHANGLRKLIGVIEALTEEESATGEALRNEQDELESQYSEVDELPDAVDQRLAEIEAALSALEDRPMTFEPAEIARAGVFVSINREGVLVVDPGYVRPEDEAPIADDSESGEDGTEDNALVDHGDIQRTAISIGGQPVVREDEDEEGNKPLPERLVGELTAHRTLALQNALADNPHVAMTALLHRMVMERYHFAAPTGCLEVSIRQTCFSAQGADLKDTLSAKAIGERYDAWKADLPSDEDALWDWIAALDDTSRMALLAHCVSYGVNAINERPNPYGGSGPTPHNLNCRLAGADRLAQATGFDMVTDANWRPTVDNYLGRVTKARILAAVREGAGERAATLIQHLKKADMAQEAERLLSDAGWLPEPLRLPAATDVEELAAEGGATAMGEAGAIRDTDTDVATPIAAE
ncbi:chromosome partitioning protein ParB [Aminobacter sp. DSM 101952]|uniref:ParB/RepB/Spo0J family partition protein n=1 Tax=unclassified Aminobacter TaxID=2644704 RepID=UPI0006F6C278|nr:MULTISPECIES: ParB/RepB/Spo0J family partition protein [unclassified Aminobacter]AWC23660.1 plasmid partitioning protein [Aminobacter sp. MSH1]KQU70106.1 chromosome partitioning protein ParB [Aminobacter sp. DSM 101952]